MSLAEKEWRLVCEEAWDGPMNMALDEVAAETVGEGGPLTLRVYRWEPSTLSLGYHQAAETVDWEFCEREGIGVTRRPTGGGGIYHDAFGDVSYSIVVPAEAVPGKLLDSYHLLLEPLLAGFERMSVSAHIADEEQPPLYEPSCYLRGVHPAHDVVVGGRKISGNAQYRQKEAVIQHGSITFESRPERHLRTFVDPEVSAAEFRSRVTSIQEEVGVGRGSAIDAIESAFREWVDPDEGTWAEEELKRARELAAQKFSSDDWTFRH